jgi:hypothetical protein
MAKQVVFGSRRFWFLSEPSARGWKATVVEVVDPAMETEDLGIEATGDTRAPPTTQPTAAAAP